jgi:hypothetical protein
MMIARAHLKIWWDGHSPRNLYAVTGVCWQVYPELA